MGLLCVSVTSSGGTTSITSSSPLVVPGRSAPSSDIPSPLLLLSLGGDLAWCVTGYVQARLLSSWCLCLCVRMSPKRDTLIRLEGEERARESTIELVCGRIASEIIKTRVRTVRPAGQSRGSLGCDLCHGCVSTLCLCPLAALSCPSCVVSVCCCALLCLCACVHQFN